jgi:succinyl-CoA synthetase beta subunit/citryl-CoA synthetase large subunit
VRLYEWEAKQLLSERGLRLPAGGLAGSPEQAGTLARGWDGAVVKAQLLRGGRMKAGLVQFADDGDSAHAAAARMFSTTLSEPPANVLVEERLPTRREHFMAALYDPRLRTPVLLYSPRGGIDVEEDAASSIVRCPFDASGPPPSFRLRGALRRAGVGGGELRALTSIAAAIAETLLELDATLVEVNPLAEVAGRGWIALDAHIELDGDALSRHPLLVEGFGLAERADGGASPTAIEQAAREIDQLDHRGVAGRLVEFDGDIALIIGGGGASLTVFDAIRDAGGHPANYCEVGGTPSVAKVAAFTRLLLERLSPTRVAVVMNVVSNTRADLVARGVIRGCLDAGRAPKDTIAVFRVPGAWEQESRELLADYGVDAFGREVGIDAASRLAVAEPAT